MPRIQRIKSRTDIYHVMIRGVNKNIIFNDDNDREKFLQILIYYKNKFVINIYAYCLMDNHVHILLKAEENFNKFMQCLQTVYALYFNKKYKRVGHLFQDRFKSIPVEKDEYLLECVRYIHQNPVKAKISSIGNYKWSSYQEYITKSRIINTIYILNLFGNKKKIALENYKTFMNIINKKADIRNIAIEDKISDAEAIELIESFFNVKIINIKEYDIIERNIILSEILDLNIFNILQLSRITKINRNIIRKIKNRKGGSKRV